MDSHPPPHTSQSSLPRSETSSHRDSEVPTEPLSLAELRRVEEYTVRRMRFLSDYERYDPVRNMQTLANQVFDLSEKVIHGLSENVRIGDEVSESRLMLDMAVTCQYMGENNLRIIGDDVIGLKANLALLEQSNEVLRVDIERLNGVLREEIGQLREDMGQLKGRVEENHRENQQCFVELRQGFAELKGMMMSFKGGSGGLQV
ncbi:hypothetical protein L873DRAFT_1798398 [Choiromyces venosus 120613-1]|uniref:Uncharacterized protein n=1 Tax=Choiromyces venosus 120613-1 TaxID=1336337 RepID=A0A3N4K953_9PEZI|nr:hypothetical protein L873DRAFT_1798398 [Choiromyces venosus 120613-1]